MKRRHEFYLDADVSEQLNALAAKPGASKTAIMSDALRAYLERRGANELDQRFRARLDRLSMQLGRIERDQQVIAEMLALFVRFQLTVTAPIPEADRAARALGQARYESFIQQVSRRLAGGVGTIEDVLHQRPSESAP
ncbi:Ribbon-helix-helix protein, copG family [Enhydrobacter aerosaccus]|uniref:Ribbon-helix-helix protein, copG family n=1 Tax=Enhydrobacter aerosaccus TaxID=225324 RepID=A0A1T4JLF4_9HYPH|nr:CopG family transcriptional regulator [Enhydrobacter aerosaccus]SJZ31005.1 Ribbon-helix-helix protein, copG family [Enhydrobacter aerosaccus]